MLKRLSRIPFIVLFASALLAKAVFSDDVYDFSESDEDDPYVYDTEEIVIEDSPIEENTAVRAGQVTVFDKETIEAMGAETVADVVERAPGVVVSRQGGILEPQTVSIRGGASEHALVLIDGKAVNSLWAGGSDLGSIDVSNIERIEVIRGAAAAIYGEGALSGVINIITSDGSAPEPAAEIEYGYASFNTHQLNGKLSAPIDGLEGLSWKLAAGGLYTGGGYVYRAGEDDLVRMNNAGWSADASAGLYRQPENDNPDGPRNDNPYEFSLSGSFHASERGVPGLMEFLTPNAEIMDIRAGGGLDFLTDTAAGSFSASSDYSYRLSRFTNPDEDIDDVNDNSSVSASAGWKKSLEEGDALLDLAADAGYLFDYLYSTALTDSTGSSVDGDAVQHTADLRARMNLIWGNFDFIPSIGFDWFLRHYKALEPTSDLDFSWSVTAGWAPFRTDYEEGPVYFKINSGTAFRNPSFRDLFWPSGALASGNPDLLPERSMNIDAGLFLSAPDSGEGISAEFEAVGFFSQVDDLIQWLPAAGGIWRPANIGRVHNSGLEISGLLILEELIGPVSLDVSVVYNWLKSVDAVPDSVNYGKQLAYRPEHSGNISCLFKIPDLLSFELTGNYLGSRFSNNSETKSIEQVFLLSAVLNYDICKNFGVSASADNLLNQSYTDRLGYPVPGIEWSLKGKVSL